MTVTVRLFRSDSTASSLPFLSPKASGKNIDQSCSAASAPSSRFSGWDTQAATFSIRAAKIRVAAEEGLQFPVNQSDSVPIECGRLLPFRRALGLGEKGPGPLMVRMAVSGQRDEERRVDGLGHPLRVVHGVVKIKPGREENRGFPLSVRLKQLGENRLEMLNHGL